MNQTQNLILGVIRDHYAETTLLRSNIGLKPYCCGGSCCETTLLRIREIRRSIYRKIDQRFFTQECGLTGGAAYAAKVKIKPSDRRLIKLRELGWGYPKLRSKGNVLWLGGFGHSQP